MTDSQPAQSHQVARAAAAGHCDRRHSCSCGQGRGGRGGAGPGAPLSAWAPGTRKGAAGESDSDPTMYNRHPGRDRAGPPMLLLPPPARHGAAAAAPGAAALSAAESDRCYKVP